MKDGVGMGDHDIYTEGKVDNGIKFNVFTLIPSYNV